MKDELAGIAAIGLYITASVAWLTAVISDASASRIGWLLADVLVPPLGAIRGLMIWFS